MRFGKSPAVENALPAVLIDLRALAA